jgi:hypothetical protein
MTDPQGRGVFEDDPFGGIKGERGNPAPPPRQVSFFHSRSDVDSSPNAQHHTLGIKHNQASFGDHAHDGKSSRKVGTGLSLTVSGAKGGNAALTSLLSMLGQIIDFTDNTT